MVLIIGQYPLMVSSPRSLVAIDLQPLVSVVVSRLLLVIQLLCFRSNLSPLLADVVFLRGLVLLELGLDALERHLPSLSRNSSIVVGSRRCIISYHPVSSQLVSNHLISNPLESTRLKSSHLESSRLESSRLEPSRLKSSRLESDERRPPSRANNCVSLDHCVTLMSQRKALVISPMSISFSFTFHSIPFPFHFYSISVSFHFRSISFHFHCISISVTFHYIPIRFPFHFHFLSSSFRFPFHFHFMQPSLLDFRWVEFPQPHQETSQRPQTKVVLDTTASTTDDPTRSLQAGCTETSTMSSSSNLTARCENPFL